ncbi:hypothetical protein A2U01_0109226 [Trifolium medium]|uniref:Uncharacterized protein n=1 Tax=Trifolium medium TaxID=97028 RepID=A0A392VLS8_9FABA|nr:hypothetical protein [Trifolium medium]
MAPSKDVEMWLGHIHRKLRLARLSGGIGGRRGRAIKARVCC